MNLSKLNLGGRRQVGFTPRRPVNKPQNAGAEQG